MHRAVLIDHDLFLIFLHLMEMRVVLIPKIHNIIVSFYYSKHSYRESEKKKQKKKFHFTIKSYQTVNRFKASSKHVKYNWYM